MKWILYSLAAILVLAAVAIGVIQILRIPSAKALHASIVKLEKEGIRTSIPRTPAKPPEQARPREQAKLQEQAKPRESAVVPPSQPSGYSTGADFFLSPEAHDGDKDTPKHWPMMRAWELAGHIWHLSESEAQEVCAMVATYTALRETLKTVSELPHADPAQLAEQVLALSNQASASQILPDRLAMLWFKRLLLFEAYAAYEDGRNDDALASCGTVLELEAHIRDFPLHQAGWWGAESAWDFLPRLLLANDISDKALDRFTAILSRHPGHETLVRGLTDEMLLNKSALESPEPQPFPRKGNILQQAYSMLYTSPMLAPFRENQLRQYLDAKGDTLRLSRIPFYQTRKRFEELKSVHSSRIGTWAVERDRAFNLLHAEENARLRQAQIAIALNRYKKHHDEYPETLQSLAPEYCQEVPVDPALGAAMGFQRQGDAFALYSAGENGINDTRIIEPNIIGGVETATGARLSPGDDWVWGYSDTKQHSYPF